METAGMRSCCQAQLLRKRSILPSGMESCPPGAVLGSPPSLCASPWSKGRAPASRTLAGALPCRLPWQRGLLGDFKWKLWLENVSL